MKKTPTCVLDDPRYSLRLKLADLLCDEKLVETLWSIRYIQKNIKNYSDDIIAQVHAEKTIEKIDKLLSIYKEDSK